MKNIFIVLSILVSIFTAGCSKDEAVNDNIATNSPNGAASQTIVINTPSIPTTKIAFEDLGFEAGIDIKWNEGDVITIYGADGTVENFTAISVDTEKKSATFSGEGLTVGESYTAVYPASTAATLESRNAEVLSTQIIDGESLDHLDKVCRMNDTFVYGADAITFEHEMAVMSIEFLMYEDSVPTEYEFTDGDNAYTLAFANVESAASYIATFMIYPNSGERILTFKDGDNVNNDITQKCTVEYKAGYRYSVNLAKANGDYFMVGQRVDNGIVYYVNPDDRRSARVISLDDGNPNLNSTPWGASLAITMPGDINQTADGAANVAYITSIEEYNSTNFTAIAFCEDKGEGWYLPARSEITLAQVYKNPYFLNGVEVNGGQPFSPDQTYWSSSIFSADKAWCVKMSNNQHMNMLKTGKARYIRCVKQVTK